MPFLTFIFYLFLLKFPWDLNLCYYLNIVPLASKKSESVYAKRIVKLHKDIRSTQHRCLERNKKKLT